jgi:DNA-binding beta-propeller fold protein YncE
MGASAGADIRRPATDRDRPVTLLLGTLALSAVAAAGAPSPIERPGRQTGGETLLPNGWRIAPAGRHISVGDMPLDFILSPDGRHLIVTNDGFNKPTLSVLDLQRGYVAATVHIDDAWFGLAFHPDGRRLYSSGGGSGKIHELAFESGRLTPLRTFEVPRPSRSSFLAGLSVTADGERLFVVHALGETLTEIELAHGEVERTLPLPAEGYATALSPDGAILAVSLWGGSRVLLFDSKTLDEKGEIAVGEHPNALAFSKDGARLFVACANTNAVWIADVASRQAREQVSVSPAPGAPPGSTPNALGLSPDGRRLLVANADNNAVALVDVAVPDHSRVEGFIPTGWYPTAAQWSGDGRTIYILSAKGLTSQPNPRGSHPGIPGGEGQYTGSMLYGAVSILPTPDAKALAAFTRTVQRLTPSTEPASPSRGQVPADSPIPTQVGGRSPIRYVFYVIRENRTYDQILGDLERGNGDPSLCLFGEDVTPNAHALAREFVLLDNFYVNAQVSYSGHAYSMGAYANDFVEKVWPMNYGGRGATYLSEGGGKQRNPYGNITAPPNGYLWDAAARAGISVLSYGEFGMRGPERGKDAGRGPVEAQAPGLQERIDPDYPPWDLRIPDNRRVDVWLEGFKKIEASGEPPRLSIIRLGNDHTAGTRPGYPIPRAMIAENDLALGRLVEAITHSRFWKESAIFVLEDDAQNGPDHVDAHRSVALVASPYVKRGAVDSTLYTTTGMLRTMELILGLPPMSQYDASATPMHRVFQSRPVLTVFEHREARVSLDEKNDVTAYGAEASLAMDFDEADRTPERELNEILWRSVRGDTSPVPPPVRAAFVIPQDPDDEEEEDHVEARPAVSGPKRTRR